MEPVNDLEMRVRTVERIQSLAALDRLEFEKKVIEYKKQSENNAIIRIIKTEEEEEDLTEMEKEIEAFKQQKRTDDDIITEMRRRVSESEIRDKKLREYNTKTIEGLRRQISACAEEIKTADRVREEMSLRESENVRRVEDLRRKNSEAAETVEGLRRRISACEEEIKTADRVREEMKVRETESKRRLEDLERQKFEADKCMKEMKARELDLRRRILEADQSVKKIKGRCLEACKLLRMNDLVSVTHGGEDAVERSDEELGRDVAGPTERVRWFTGRVGPTELQCLGFAYLFLSERVFDVNLQQAAWISAVPWGTMAISGYIAGSVSDYLIKSDYSITSARKIMQSIGFIGPGVALLCLNYDIAPQYAGFLHGISNSAGTLAAIICTIGTGFFVQWLGSFKHF
ncbi:probable anion transporter 3 chloroplastic [Phtheirospermum japonicum]|uniref:Probable anion transporter 3 chloroplastic n=1 Tax=Phtheirospermum japonicum TaxID=374723 RepID=A0A830CR63_9LAMI|nr:probable anion transporter 3 chloroplastic [Phtheirospermum japonicum]